MARPLITEDGNDVQFQTGQFIPMVVNVWDGSNGEHGLLGIYFSTLAMKALVQQ
jgi:hypothetical protein